MSSKDSNKGTKLYVGNLPADVRSEEVESLFKKYGRVRDVDVKNRNESSFAFVNYDSLREAEDALRGRNNYRYEGRSLKVEISKGGVQERGGRGGSPQGGGYRGSFNGRYEDRGPRGGGGGSKPFGNKARSTEFRVRVTGLPHSASWQDLKDHMKAAGDVSYADVFRDGTGVCDYHNEDDLKYAVKTLDNSEMKTFRGDVGRIRIEKDISRMPKRSRTRSRSGTPPRRRRRTPDYSPGRRRSSSRSSSSR